jgi:hypothetical protein
LIRYSHSFLSKGCFVLNINKGKPNSNGGETIENFVIQYHSQWEKFVFNQKPYETLRKFLEDPIYSKILKEVVPNSKFVDVSVSNQKELVTSTQSLTSSTSTLAVSS